MRKFFGHRPAQQAEAARNSKGESMRKFFGHRPAQQAEAARNSKGERQKRSAFSTLLGWLRSKSRKPKRFEEMNKSTVSLKLVLTKEAVIQLLALCVRDGEELLTQIGSELGRTPDHGSWSPTLESIPEDY